MSEVLPVKFSNSRFCLKKICSNVICLEDICLEKIYSEEICLKKVAKESLIVASGQLKFNSENSEVLLETYCDLSN